MSIKCPRCGYRISQEKEEKEKVFHLHLETSMGGKLTLICYLKNNSISYTLYGGWSSSGVPNSLANLGLRGGELPVYVNEDESKKQFINRVKKLIDEQSNWRVVREIKGVAFND